MRVRCVAVEPTPEQAASLGKPFLPGRTEYPIHIGREYLVLGIRFGGGAVWYDIAPTRNLILAVPALLFEIVQARLSSHWVAQVYEEGSFELCPPALTHKHFHYDLSEGVQEAVDEFYHLYRILEVEDAAYSVGGRG